MERHCAEMLCGALRGHPENPLTPHEIVSYVTRAPRLRNPAFRTFDVGNESCGRLAVARLIELHRTPDLPVNICHVYSPGM